MSHLSRIFGAVTLAAAAVLAGGQAQALTATNGAFFQASETCDYVRHTMNGQIVVKPQPGWSSQYVAVRALVANDTGSQIGSWFTGQVYANTSYLRVGGDTYQAPGWTRIWHQYMWWNGSAWVANTGWVEDTYYSTATFTNIGIAGVQVNACYT